MHDTERLRSARAVLQKAVDELYQLADNSTFDVLDGIMSSEFDAHIRRSRLFVATAMMSLLPPQVYEEADELVHQEGRSLDLLAVAQTIADRGADEIVALWGDSDPPEPPVVGEDSPDDVVRTTVWLVLDDVAWVRRNG